MAGEAYAPVVSADSFPLSAAQLALWLVEQLRADRAMHIEGCLLRVGGDVDPHRLRDVIADVVHRHRALRIGCDLVDGWPRQRVYGDVRIDVAAADFSALPPASAARGSARWSARLGSAPFDVSRPPLWRAGVAKLPGGLTLTALVAHHLICDGWTLRLLLEEISEEYRTGVLDRGHADDLPPYPECLLDRDNSRRQDSSVNAYWRSVLRECDPPRVKVARPTEAAVSADKAASAVHASVPAAVSRLLRDVARHYDVTPFLAFVAAYAVTIGLLTGAHHIPVGTAAHGRPTAQLKRIAGMFATTLVLPVDLAGELTFGDLLARLRETYRAVMANRHVTLEDLSAGRNLVRAPIFRHVLSYHPASFTVSSFAGMPASMELISETGTQYELELHVRDLGDSFSLQLRFDPAVFDTGSAAAVAGTLSILLADLPANPQKSIASCQVSLPHDFTQEL